MTATSQNGGQDTPQFWPTDGDKTKSWIWLSWTQVGTESTAEPHQWTKILGSQDQPHWQKAYTGVGSTPGDIELYSDERSNLKPFLFSFGLSS